MQDLKENNIDDFISYVTKEFTIDKLPVNYFKTIDDCIENNTRFSKNFTRSVRKVPGLFNIISNYLILSLKSKLKISTYEGLSRSNFASLGVETFYDVLPEVIKNIDLSYKFGILDEQKLINIIDDRKKGYISIIPQIFFDTTKLPKELVNKNHLVIFNYLKNKYNLSIFEELNEIHFSNDKFVINYKKNKEIIDKIDPSYKFGILTSDKLEKIINNRRNKITNSFPFCFFKKEILSLKEINENYKIIINYIFEKNQVGTYEQLTQDMFTRDFLTKFHPILQKIVRDAIPEYQYGILTNEKLIQIINDKKSKKINFISSDFFDNKKNDNSEIIKNKRLIFHYIMKENLLNYYEEISNPMFDEIGITLFNKNFKKNIIELFPDYDFGILTERKIESIVKRLDTFSSFNYIFPLVFFENANRYQKNNLSELERYILKQNNIKNKEQITIEMITNLAEFGRNNPIVKNYFGLLSKLNEKSKTRQKNGPKYNIQSHTWSRDEINELFGLFNQVEISERIELYQNKKNELMGKYGVTEDVLKNKLFALNLIPRTRDFQVKSPRGVINKMPYTFFPSFVQEYIDNINVRLTSKYLTNIKQMFREVSDGIKNKTKNEYTHAFGIVYDSADNQFLNVLLPISYSGIYNSCGYNEIESNIINLIAQYIKNPDSFNNKESLTRLYSGRESNMVYINEATSTGTVFLNAVKDEDKLYVKLFYRKNDSLKIDDFKDLITAENLSIELFRLNNVEYTVNNTGIIKE